jgi:hypothetical protein
MSDGTIVAYGFPPDVAPSEALHLIADGFRDLGAVEAMTPAECLAFAATVRELASRVAWFELSLGIFHSNVIYDAANQSEPPLFPHHGDAR